MSQVAIQVEGLVKRYGAITALDAATLRAETGQIFGLVGPNGSGKTTLIKAICGILKTDAGRIRVLGLDAASERHAVRRRLGYMPQTPSLYDDLSALENLTFFGSAFGRKDLDARVRQSLEFVKLWDRRDDPLHTFSGGMRQRASLACALLHDPELLLLDEPTAGVDPALRQAFWKHFRELVGAGRTIFISTNQMDEAMHCDRIAVIRRGSVLVCESPQAIVGRGRTSVELTTGEGVRTREMEDYESELPRLLAGYGLDPAVKSISIRRQNLEDVILGLIEDEPA